MADRADDKKQAGGSAGDDAAEQALTGASKRKPKRGVKGGRVPVMTFRASELEQAEIRRRAQEAGYRVGTFARLRLLGDPGERARRAPPVNAEAIAQLTAQVLKLGNNVNQIARVLHAMGRYSESHETAELYRDIGATLAAIRTAVLGKRGGP